MKGNATYQIKQIVSAVIMVLSLAWLTISIPFVYESQHKLACENSCGIPGAMDEESSPFSNTTEEKTESGTNTLSEYLHDMHLHEQVGTVLQKYSKCHPSDLYYAFHPELISPPPECARS